MFIQELELFIGPVCVQEVLQAVKSKSQEMINQMEQQQLREEYGQGDGPRHPGDQPSRHRHTSGGHEHRHGSSNPLRRSGSLRDDRLISGTGEGASASAGRRTAGQDAPISKGQRRIKLGNKAADLFAKLSVKLNSRNEST